MPDFNALAARFWPFWLFYIRKLALPIVLFLIVTAFIGFKYGQRIRIDTNLLHLLPAETDSLQRLNGLRRESEVKGFLSVIVSSKTAIADQVLIDAAAELERRIRVEPALAVATGRVTYDIPADFLVRYSLYYADYEDLQRVRERLKKSIEQSRRKENPYFEDLEETAPTKFYIGDILNKYRKKYLATNAFIDRAHHSITILLSLKVSAEDTGFTSGYIDKINSVMREYAQDRKLSLSFSGPYMQGLEKQKRLQNDISQSTTMTLLILLASLIIFFRSLRVLVVIGLPVIAALGYTYHAAWYFIGTISIISSFLTSILLGLGIDYGIHLFSRYKAERLSGRGMSEALQETMANLFRGLSFGMISTAAVFAALSFSNFIAFAEFGKIALMGIVFFFITFIIFFPALIFLTEKYSFTTTEPSHFLEKTTRTRGWHVALIISVLCYGIFVATSPPFEYDFFALDSKARSAALPESEASRVLENREQMVVFAFSSLDDLATAETNLRATITKEDAEFHSIRDLIATDTGRKAAVLKEIHGLFEQARILAAVTLDVENLRRVGLGIQMTESAPPNIADLPAAFKQHLVHNGKYFLYIFPRRLEKLKRGALDFAANHRLACTVANTTIASCPADKVVRAVSDLYVLDDILQTVLKDLAKEVLLIVAVILLIVLSLTRRIAGLILILAPLLAGVLGLFAAVGLAHHFSNLWLFEFNYINLLAIPILLGVGIDNGIYLYSHVRELGLAQVNHIMVNTGGSIFISNFTTAMGFLSLTISNHVGLASFGFITFLGMLCIFYAYRVLFPALARFFEKMEAKI